MSKTSTSNYILVSKPFDFRGNERFNGIQESDFHFTGAASLASVKKFGNRGDGDIYTVNGGKTIVQLEAKLDKLNDKIARLNVTYYVWESSFETTNLPDRDKLYFTAYEDIDLGEFFGSTTDGNGNVTKSRSWNFSEQPKKAVYKGSLFGVNHRWNRFDSSSYPSVNKSQSWMPASSLEFKVDDADKELIKGGNIGIRGKVEFWIRVTEERVEKDETLPSFEMETVSRKQTDGTVRRDKEIEIDDNAYSVLGCGYDITGEYASIDYVKQPVLDLDALKTHKRVERNNNSSITSSHFSGSNTKEVSESYEKEIGASASVSMFGVTFKNETSKTVKDSDFSKSTTRVASTKITMKKSTYKIDGYQELGYLMPFLTDKFKRDLDTLSADRIISLYGTHVILGAVLGARVNYAMSYLQSVAKHSHSETFATASSVSYDSTTGILHGDPVPQSNAAKASDAVMTISNINFTDCTINNYLVGNGKSSSSQSNGGNMSGGSSSKIGGNASLKYTETTSADVNEENESTQISISGCGGNEMYLAQFLGGNREFSGKWADSLKGSSSWVWCDFVKDTLIPIYMLVPNSTRAKQIRDAWMTYLKNRGSSIVPMGEKTLSCHSVLQGSEKDVTELRGDSNVCTRNGGLSQFQLMFTPINIDGGKVAVAVCYKVSESYMQGGNGTFLQMSKVIEMPCDYSYKYAVSPDVKPYESAVLSYVGVAHGWIDITEQLESCPYVDTKSSRVLVKIDGPATDDRSNLKISAKFCVPVIYYKR